MAHERILIVEDENLTGLDIRRTLQEFGYEPVGPVASGKAAIEHTLTHHPDVILMDIVLKGPIDGIETAHAIQSQYRCPVIYVTAYSDESTVDRAKVTEPFGYILKPINEQELYVAIEMAVYRHRKAGSDSGPAS